MQQSYRSVCLLPLLADSVVVIDEVHSFDKSLFSVLKRFLQHFDVPVLCMTASLPAVRRNELAQECGLHIFPEEENCFDDLDAIANMPRYRVQHLESAEEAETIALQAFKSGKRVLWVVNTVSRCQEIARRLQALCYHGRFRLKDRKNQHERVIRAFGNDQTAVLAVTTQVCEMSLEEHGPNIVNVSKYAAFLENGPWANSREESLRDENQFTVTARWMRIFPNFSIDADKKALSMACWFLFRENLRGSFRKSVSSR